MDGHKAAVKAFQDKVSAQLDEVKAKLDEAKAHAKSNAAQAELHTITELQKAHADIEKQRGELHTAESAKADSLKANITTHLASLKEKVDTLHSKLHHAMAAK